jgi:hypothetical protein
MAAAGVWGVSVGRGPSCSFLLIVHGQYVQPAMGLVGSRSPAGQRQCYAPERQPTQYLREL